MIPLLCGEMLKDHGEINLALATHLSGQRRIARGSLLLHGMSERKQFVR